MANAGDKTVTVDVVARNWILKALDTQKAVLQRKIAGELSEEVVDIRKKEVSKLDEVKRLFM